MSKVVLRKMDCYVDPDNYPEERLMRERLALLLCIGDEKIEWFNGPGDTPMVGKYYIAFSSGIFNPFSRLVGEEPRYTALVLKRDGRASEPLLLENFKVVSDPAGVMEAYDGINWNLWNWLKMMEARAKLMDMGLFEYPDSYLTANRFALVRYPETAQKTGAFVPGGQYLAITQKPDISPCVYIDILTGDPAGEADRKIAMFRDFDILSDPLGLLDPWKTDWEENEWIQKELRPGLYRQDASGKAV